MPLGAKQRWSPVGVPSPSPQAGFIAMNHTNYERFMAGKQDSCKEALAVVRDAYWWALASTALLEDKIERLSCPSAISGLEAADPWVVTDAWVAADEEDPRLGMSN